RIASRDVEADAPETLREIGQPLRQRDPMVAAIGRLPEPAAGSLPRAVLPRPLPRRPERRVDRVGLRWVDAERDRAGVLVAVEHSLERLAAILRPKDSALFVRPVRMAERRDEQAPRIARIDDDRPDLLAVAQPEVRPVHAAVGRTI